MVDTNECQLTHGDLKASQILFCEDDKSWYLIDFSKSIIAYINDDDILTLNDTTTLTDTSDITQLLKIFADCIISENIKENILLLTKKVDPPTAKMVLYCIFDD